MATSGQSTNLAAAGDLKRILNFRSLFCVAIGLVVAQNVMVALLNGAGQGGWAFLAVLLFAYLLTLCYASSFAELALMFPRAGTLSTYTEVALGHFPAIVATFCGYIMVAIFGNSAELMIADEILARLLPLDLPPMTLAFSIIVFLTTLNLLGVDIFDKFQSLVVFMMVVALLIIGGGAVFGFGLTRPEAITLFEPGSPLGWGVIALLALAMWGFVGAEFVCPMVEETQQPKRNLPNAMFWGSTLILVIYLLFTAGALLYVPGEALANSELPHFDYVLAVFGEPGLVFLTVAVITATCSTLNTSIASISRIVYGMARNGQFCGVQKGASPVSNPLGGHSAGRLLKRFPDLIWGGPRDGHHPVNRRLHILAAGLRYCPCGRHGAATQAGALRTALQNALFPGAANPWRGRNAGRHRLQCALLGDGRRSVWHGWAVYRRRLCVCCNLG